MKAKHLIDIYITAIVHKVLEMASMTCGFNAVIGGARHNVPSSYLTLKISGTELLVDIDIEAETITIDPMKEQNSFAVRPCDFTMDLQKDAEAVMKAIWTHAFYYSMELLKERGL